MGPTEEINFTKTGEISSVINIIIMKNDARAMIELVSPNLKVLVISQQNHQIYFRLVQIFLFGL